MHEIDITTILVGLSMEDAEELAAHYGKIIRVTHVDGSSCTCTMDIEPNRINVEVDSNNFITSIKGFG